jgi:hypothetical protein
MGMDLLDCLKGEEASVGYSWLKEMKSQIIHQDLVLICFFSLVTADLLRGKMKM